MLFCCYNNIIVYLAVTPTRQIVAACPVHVCAFLQDAIHHEHGRDFMGSRIVVEWARGPKVTSKMIFRLLQELLCASQ